MHEKAMQVRQSNPAIIKKIQRIPLNLSLCAIDGGVLSYRLHGSDVVVVRAVGVHFVYENDKLKSFEHYPRKKPESCIGHKTMLDEHEAGIFRSLIRLKYELECALNSLEKFSPQLILIDGSLLPLPCDRPQKESELNLLYDEVVSLYSKLFSECKKIDCGLCGVIKDSRARRITDKYGIISSDSIFCNYLLAEGEMTGEVSYYENKKQDELSAFAEYIKVIYMKASDDSIPLRIEIFDSGETSKVDNLASIVYSLSSISKRFAYPAILTEADMCAAFDSKEYESFESRLLSISGVDPLRRNSRPFR